MYILFSTSCLLFISYTVVSLWYLRKKHYEWKDVISSLTQVRMIDYQGNLVPDPVAAMQILEESKSKYEEYAKEADRVQLNIMKLAIVTVACGIVTSAVIIFF